MNEENKKIAVLYIKDKMEHSKKIYQAVCLGGSGYRDDKGMEFCSSWKMRKVMAKLLMIWKNCKL